MKISKLITALLILIGMTAMHNVNAQDSIHVKSKYKCWIYDNPDDMSSSREGVIYSVADSGINLAASMSGNTFREDDRQLQYIPVSKIDYIGVRKKGSVGRGILIGGGIGILTGVLLGYASGDDEAGIGGLSADTKAGIAGFVFCFPGMLIGALIGSQKLEFEINRKQRNYKRQKQEIRGYAIIQ